MDEVEQFFFHAKQHQTPASAHHGIAGHQLRMRETFVDIFVDDVGLVQDEVAFNQNRHLVVRIHDGKVFGFVENINIFDFKIHAFFVQHETAALAERAGNA